jgi:hypothetical protein
MLFENWMNQPGQSQWLPASPLLIDTPAIRNASNLLKKKNANHF